MLTDEQITVVNAPLRGILKVKAFAGTGKTTCLVHKAQRHAAEDGCRGLYVAFNKSAQTDAQSRFGQSAICKTGHALAFPRFGQKYKHKLRSMKPLEVIQITGLVSEFTEARILLDAVNDWCISDAMEFPSKIRLGEMANRISPVRAAQLNVMARQLWDLMCDPESAVPMPHDGYFKLFQLSRPRLPGDYLMVDEFQDTNPVMLDVIRRQTQPMIVVGDSHQSIYAFRGAVNAMETFKADKELAITQSFRFGEKVARVANALLDIKREPQLLIGLGPSTALNWNEQRRPAAKSISIISRTNAGLFGHAVEAIRSEKSLSFVGGVLSYNLHKLSDARHIANGNFAAVRDPFLRSFKSYWQLQEYADEVEDMELMRLVKTCDEYGDQIFELVDAIHAKARTDLDAQIILSTAHRCKGMTLEHVVMADDFPAIVEDDELVDELDLQEINLAYVTATRAVHSLTLNATTKDYLLWRHDRFGPVQ